MITLTVEQQTELGVGKMGAFPQTIIPDSYGFNFTLS